GQPGQIFLLLIRRTEVDDWQSPDSHMAAESHAEAAIHRKVLSNDGRSDLVHVRPAISFRNIHVADADLAGLADELARYGELLVLNLFRIGQNFIFREVLRRLYNLLVLLAQIFQREHLLSGVLFNQEAATFEFRFIWDCYRCHNLILLLTTEDTEEHRGNQLQSVPSTNLLIPSFRWRTWKLINKPTFFLLSRRYEIICASCTDAIFSTHLSSTTTRSLTSRSMR